MAHDAWDHLLVRESKLKQPEDSLEPNTQKAHRTGSSNTPFHYKS